MPKSMNLTWLRDTDHYNDKDGWQHHEFVLKEITPDLQRQVESSRFHLGKMRVAEL